MNIKDRMILSDYNKRKEDLYKVDSIVAEKLKEIVKKSKVLTTGIEHRVKTEQSLEGKLYKNSGICICKTDTLCCIPETNTTL